MRIDQHSLKYQQEKTNFHLCFRQQKLLGGFRPQPRGELTTLPETPKADGEGNIHRESKKHVTKLLFISSPNIDGF